MKVIIISGYVHGVLHYPRRFVYLGNKIPTHENLKKYCDVESEDEQIVIASISETDIRTYAHLVDTKEEEVMEIIKRNEER